MRRRLGDVVFSDDDETLERAVSRLLLASGRTLAAAESLTGGGVGARMSASPGASKVFVGSAVVYTAEAKHRVLGVTRATIEGPGVVSAACAAEMAMGARRLYEADVAVSLTGAAGPEPHAGAPPGTVWIGLEADGVSRVHAAFERFGDAWCVRDLGSRNGTFVNGDRIIGERALHSGDEIVLGRLRLLFHAPTRGKETAAIVPPPPLTPRERDVLVALCRPLLAGDAFTEPQISVMDQ